MEKYVYLSTNFHSKIVINLITSTCFDTGVSSGRLFFDSEGCKYCGVDESIVQYAA